MIFKEPYYKAEKWEVEIPTSGYASVMPIFFSFQTTLHTQPHYQIENPPDPYDVEKFIQKIMNRMNASTEVCLMSLIFIEKLLKKGGVQLLTINWRPIVYTAMLLATKYWEDY